MAWSVLGQSMAALQTEPGRGKMRSPEPEVHKAAVDGGSKVEGLVGEGMGNRAQRRGF
jgi:hypothetical protein